MRETGYLPDHMVGMEMGAVPSFAVIDLKDAFKKDAIQRCRALLDTDDYAAGLVAATVSTVQSTNESRPAFVKRIVRAWLEEMAHA